MFPEQDIISAIVNAIAEQRLPAGTKLGEQMLSDLFNCNRANVRRALSTLATMNIVQLKPNRGAFVSIPTPKEARHIFEARRVIECSLGAGVIEHTTVKDIEELHAYISEEHEATNRGNKPLALRLSRKFHIRLAQIADNQVLERILYELTLRTTLIIGLYTQSESKICPKEEHSSIVTAIEKRDEKRFVELINQHLTHLESNLDFDQIAKPFGVLNQLG